jgi:predicted TIM-barrel fold metal-dependent hydrolase
MRIVDTHTHVVSEDRARYPLVTEERTEATAWFLDHGITVEELLNRMDGAGVDAAVLVQAGSSYGTDHSYVVDSVPAAGGRLVGIGTVDVTGDEPGARARHAIEVEGLSGIRLFDLGTGELSADGALAVVRQVADLHVPLLVFTTLQRIRRCSPSSRRCRISSSSWTIAPFPISARGRRGTAQARSSPWPTTPTSSSRSRR